MYCGYYTFVHPDIASYVFHCRDEKAHIKLPTNLDDAKNMGLVLTKYRKDHYYQVLSAFFLSYVLYPLFTQVGNECVGCMIDSYGSPYLFIIVQNLFIKTGLLSPEKSPSIQKYYPDLFHNILYLKPITECMT